MMKEEKCFITGPVGRLEALTHGLEKKSVTRLGVVCHPHPQYQGTMQNKVVTTIVKAWNELGLATVRFNFRGVGESEGSYGNGVGEIEDLRAVLEHLKLKHPEAEFWLGGFSFGSVIATKMSAHWPISALLSIAPPIHLFSLNDFKMPSCPWIIIQGDADEIVPVDQVVAWHKSLQKNVRFILMKGASHFFHGRLIELKSHIVEEMKEGVRHQWH